jgi:hypothetical protein
VCGSFCRKNIVVWISGRGGRATRYFAGSHTGNIGKNDGYIFGDKSNNRIANGARRKTFSSRNYRKVKEI